MKRLLVLEDGTVFEGKAFGADLYVSGELVFSTAMTGYQELITDQAFSGQILSFTFPVIGAAGINRDDSESITPTCLAVVVQHLVEMPSNWRQQMTLDEFLKRKKIPGIMGIDTRQVAKIVRKHGRMKATVINKGDSIEHILDQLRATVLPKDQVRQVSTKTAYAVPGFGKSIALIDLGVKHSVLRQLSQRDCNVTVYPYDISYHELMEQQPDGVILSSGPGDPHQVKKLCHLIKKLNGQIPIWGMGLGAQVLAQAYGAELVPMEVGHFGLNIPVREIATGKIELTSQNHLYSISRNSLPHDLLITHENVNDHSIEAFRHRYQPILGVQFQVDASPGPRENLYFYDEFLEFIDAKLHESRREKE